MSLSDAQMQVRTGRRTSFIWHCLHHQSRRQCSDREVLQVAGNREKGVSAKRRLKQMYSMEKKKRGEGKGVKIGFSAGHVRTSA